MPAPKKPRAICIPHGDAEIDGRAIYALKCPECGDIDSMRPEQIDIEVGADRKPKLVVNGLRCVPCDTSLDMPLVFDGPQPLAIPIEDDAIDWIAHRLYMDTIEPGGYGVRWNTARVELKEEFRTKARLTATEWADDVRRRYKEQAEEHARLFAPRKGGT